MSVPVPLVKITTDLYSPMAGSIETISAVATPLYGELQTRSNPDTIDRRPINNLFSLPGIQGSVYLETIIHNVKPIDRDRSGPLLITDSAQIEYEIADIYTWSLSNRVSALGYPSHALHTKNTPERWIGATLLPKLGRHAEQLPARFIEISSKGAATSRNTYEKSDSLTDIDMWGNSLLARTVSRGVDPKDGLVIAENFRDGLAFARLIAGIAKVAYGIETDSKALKSLDTFIKFWSYAAHKALYQREVSV